MFGAVSTQEAVAGFDSTGALSGNSGCLFGVQIYNVKKIIWTTKKRNYTEIKNRQTPNVWNLPVWFDNIQFLISDRCLVRTS